MASHDMRFTVVDADGSISFVDDGFVMLPLVAGCSSNPRSTRELLTRAGDIDRRVRSRVIAGLHVFDEHNVDGDYGAIHQELEQRQGLEEPVFRVVDEVTRQRSLLPTKTGLILFNLKDRRIVELLNHFYAVERAGEVHLHDGRRYSKQTVTYSLPGAWSIVP